jgi:hypothetical protein
MVTQNEVVWAIGVVKDTSPPNEPSIPSNSPQIPETSTTNLQPNLTSPPPPKKTPIKFQLHPTSPAVFRNYINFIKIRIDYN